MKKVINLLLLVMVITFSNTANAAGKFSVEITNSSMVNVSLTDVLKGEKLSLKDYDGVVLFNETLDAVSSYQKYFNFSAVANGLYFLETESEYEIKVTPVLKNGKGVSLVNNSAVSIFKPMVKVNNNVVSVMLNNYKNTPLTFKIYDVKGILLVEESVKEERLFERMYDFSNISAGTYYMYFGLGDRTFTKEIKILQ